jgi:predicted amidophosphoribosyltransferase
MSNFCSACGVRLDVVCPSCQHPIAAGSRFCADCGHFLDPALIKESSPPELPESLASLFVAPRAAIEGETHRG